MQEKHIRPAESVVSTIPERCKRCYCCVRECPANAIQIRKGQAVVVAGRCIACGNCIKVCTQNAKSVRDGKAPVREMIAARGSKELIACIAPSFPAAFPEYEPLRVVGAIHALGFTKVLETAFGADLVSQAYKEYAATNPSSTITTPCPAIVEYIQKYYPDLIPRLAPIVSPMIAIGMAARERYGKQSTLVFIGPCVAKKMETLDPEVEGVIDEVLTFDELMDLFEECGIDPASCPEKDFDQPHAYQGQIYPVSGGLLKSAEIASDVMNPQVVVVEGRQRCIEMIHEMADGNVEADMIDILFCEGCINGPGITSTLHFYERRKSIIDFVKQRTTTLNKTIWKNSMQNFRHLDLFRKFSDKRLQERMPEETEIQAVLSAANKERPEDRLNCGACGYESCRELAIAVCQGLAEPEMCLPYTIDTLEKSHRELAAAQEQLIHSEKLASVGQLAAGVAHEINNPLGTILLYSHLLLKQIGEADQARDDLRFIIEEAERCKNIVGSLLNFARQGKLQVAETTADALVKSIIAMLEYREDFHNVTMHIDVEERLPPLFIDAEQIKQVLLNIAVNACEAMPEGGTLSITANVNAAENEIVFRIADTGCGIPKENLSRLFTPFFTTKQIGKGTGLGLPIAYGIVKMHHGKISVQSEEGAGTAFTVTIPVDVRTLPSRQMTPPDFAAALMASTGTHATSGNEFLTEE